MAAPTHGNIIVFDFFLLIQSCTADIYLHHLRARHIDLILTTCSGALGLGQGFDSLLLDEASSLPIGAGSAGPPSAGTMAASYEQQQERQVRCTRNMTRTSVGDFQSCVWYFVSTT